MTISHSKIFAIDPGNELSAYCITDMNLKPRRHEKLANYDLLGILHDERDADNFYAIEMIASYGMPVGKEVFDTCVWIGRFTERIYEETGRVPILVYRKDEKLTICNSPRANDATIRQALVDRFAYGVPNKGKGTKKDPGWFYGFKADEWAAYAVAVTFYEKHLKDILEG